MTAAEANKSPEGDTGSRKSGKQAQEQQPTKQGLIGKISHDDLRKIAFANAVLFVIYSDLVLWLVSSGAWWVVAGCGLVKLVTPETDVAKLLKLDVFFEEEKVHAMADKLSAVIKYCIQSVVVPIVAWESAEKSSIALAVLMVFSFILSVVPLFWLVALGVNAGWLAQVYREELIEAGKPHYDKVSEVCTQYWQMIPRYSRKAE